MRSAPAATPFSPPLARIPQKASASAKPAVQPCRKRALCDSRVCCVLGWRASEAARRAGREERARAMRVRMSAKERRKLCGGRMEA